jgi:hypothetical protein
MTLLGRFLQPIECLDIHPKTSMNYDPAHHWSILLLEELV